MNLKALPLIQIKYMSLFESDEQLQNFMISRNESDILTKITLSA